MERFPRSQKFLLGDRFQTSALDVQERLIEATYTKRRGEPLIAANPGIETLRFLCRLAHNLHYLVPSESRMRGIRTSVLSRSMVDPL